MVDLAAVAQTYRRNLRGGTTTAFSVDSLDRLGLPVRIALHRPHDDVQVDGFGYGHTPDEALVGAMGELAETVYSNAWLQACEHVHASYHRMREQHGERGVVDPIALSLPAGSAYAPDRPLTWVAAKRWPTQETVYVPLEAAASNVRHMRGTAPLYTPITNGRGAGMSVEQALAHGLLELLQRDGNCTAFRALDQGVVIDLDVIEDSSILVLLKQLASADIEVMAKLVTTDFGFVNLHVVGRDHGAAAFPMMVTACGEAAHPDREFALRKALLEFAAARSRKAFMHGDLAAAERIAPPGYLDAARARFEAGGEEPRSLLAMASWCAKDVRALEDLLSATVFSERKRVPLSSLPSPSAEAMREPAARCKLVSERLRAAGHDILYVDFTPAGAEITVTKAIVTGLECETMSYYRIGERGVRRALARGDDFVGVGKTPAGCLPVRLTAASRERLGNDAWLDTNRIDAIVGELYPLYREPSSHAVQMYLARQRRAAS